MEELDNALGDKARRMSLNELARSGKKDIRVIKKDDLVQLVTSIVQKVAQSSNLSLEKTNIVQDEIIQAFGSGVDQSFLKLRDEMKLILQEIKNNVSSGSSISNPVLNKLEIQEQKLQGLFTEKASGTIYSEIKSEVEDVSKTVEKLKKMRGG